MFSFFKKWVGLGAWRQPDKAGIADLRRAGQLAVSAQAEYGAAVEGTVFLGFDRLEPSQQGELVRRMATLGARPVPLKEQAMMELSGRRARYDIEQVRRRSQVTVAFVFSDMARLGELQPDEAALTWAPRLQHAAIDMRTPSAE